MKRSAGISLGELLARYRIELTVEEVLDEADSAFAAIERGTSASGAEVDFLHANADPSTAAVIGTWSAGTEGRARARIAARQMASAPAGSLSVREAAASLGIAASSVSRRITRKLLWACDMQGHRRIPGWQFRDDELLAGLDVIMPAIPPGALLQFWMRLCVPRSPTSAPVRRSSIWPMAGTRGGCRIHPRLRALVGPGKNRRRRERPRTTGSVDALVAPAPVTCEVIRLSYWWTWGTLD